MPADPSGPQLSWDIARDVGALLEYHFMINALIGGTLVAVSASFAGWLMVLRREAFAGHTLSVMAFPGASAAALAGIPAAWGYYGFCTAAALAIARSPGAARGGPGERAAAIAAVQASALAAGFLFVSLYGGVLGDLETLLFGNPLAISDGQLRALGTVVVLTLVALALIGRPLLFASVDPNVANARGVRVGALSAAFLLALGLSIAAASQITGPLLVFTVLIVPPATAQTLTARPALSLALTLGVALAVVWIGLGIAYFSNYPAGVYVTAVSCSLYVLARAVSGARARRRTRAGRPLAEGAVS